MKSHSRVCVTIRVKELQLNLAGFHSTYLFKDNAIFPLKSKNLI